MDIGRDSVSSVLRRMELGLVSDASHHLHGHTALVRRMGKVSVLKGHAGCVNRLALSEDAAFLLSGSDDCTLRLWNIQDAETVSQKAVVYPGHYANIFGVTFMPNTNNSYVASTGLDRQVRLTHVEDGTSTLWACHEKTVKTVTALDTNVFISASKDGTARLFDSRLPPSPDQTKRPNIAIRIPNRRRRPTGLNSVMLSPICSHHVVVAASDAYIRIFDLRFSVSSRLSNVTQSDHSLQSAGYCVEKFCPPHLHETAPEQCTPFESLRRTYSTYATFSSDAKQIVASYYDDTVHVFNRSEEKMCVSSSPPFASRAEKQYAVWNMTQHTAAVLHRKFFSFAIGRANRILEIDPTNILGLVYKSDALLRREASGDFRAAFAMLSRLLRLVHDDPFKITHLWGSDSPASPLCFSAQFKTCREKAEVWLKVFEYMQAYALYRMIPPLQFSMLLRPSSSNKVFMRKRLEYLDILCADLERYRDGKLRSRSPQHSWKEVAKRKALGNAEEAEELYRNGPSKQRAAVLIALVDKFLTGIASLREKVDDRMACVLPDDCEQDQACDIVDSDVPWSSDSDDDSAQNRDRRQDEDVKQADTEMVVSEETSDASEGSDSSLWGPCLTETPPISFHGHISRQTDIKEASFFGSRNQMVLSGSDDGHVYIWSATSSELLGRVYADEQIVNCVLPHPTYPMIISSGIDDTIKLITPGDYDLDEQ